MRGALPQRSFDQRAEAQSAIIRCRGGAGERVRKRNMPLAEKSLNTVKGEGEGGHIEIYDKINC